MLPFSQARMFVCFCTLHLVAVIRILTSFRIFSKVPCKGKDMFLQTMNRMKKYEIAEIIAISVLIVILSVILSSTAQAEGNDEDLYISGVAQVQLSEEDGLEPFDVKKIAGLIVAGVISEEEFFELYAEQGVSEEQLVAVLEKVYIQQGFQVGEGIVSGIVHRKLFPEAKSMKNKTINSLSRATQASSCGTTSVEKKEPKKNVKKGPLYPYAVQKVSNTFCGTDSDWILDYNLNSDFAKNKSKVRWWNKDWWFQSLFGSLTASLCQKPEKGLSWWQYYDCHTE